jgi:hypothetical protein
MDERFTISDPWLLRPLPIFGTLSPEEYAELGFMCGLEVHQQLLTERKLFCRCPAGRYHTERITTLRSCATCVPRSRRWASTTAPR